MSCTSVNAQDPETITVLNATDFQKAIQQKNIKLVDVRTAEEYKVGAIDDAVNIDFLQPETFENQFEKLDRKTAVFIYCRSGNRSGKAALKLKAMGFEAIYDLEGGFMNWANKDLD
ncbi:rhodanese-like domain-containing protein [Subsaximicrobium wynnwilliamsii]|uniref:Rhodanese-like domain-containing protein n=2 Tax=Subsaximicrobium wynnwilliamsii TaxID=291179 RepID=A0A5C6ZJE4_9FLAO|nr:rhodanese-like domain-containing protein [Subsaximicrobium wynnwilliamsii]TXD90304.1 rhodanese-like domain-containing protein [Subsaximicrobium wynnwilliamsii]TXE04355.1 rhodanese-like domain-containing protein [Subsaximicrobium wynnwilliamsii]